MKNRKLLSLALAGLLSLSLTACGGDDQTSTGVLESRIRLRIAGLMCMISKAGTSPPVTSGRSCWDTRRGHTKNAEGTRC